MATLTIRRGFNKGAAYRLGHRSLTLGRDKGNMIQVIDEGVSRRHAFLRWNGSEHVIQDLQSHNGVFVNGKRVTESAIRPGDKLVVGDTELEVTMDISGTADAVLGRKIVDKDIVGATTRGLDDDDRSPQEIIAAGRTVDVDRHADRRTALATRFMAELLQASYADPPAEVHKRAASGIGRLIQPDRCFLLRITGERKLEHVASAVDPTLDTDHTQAPIHAESVRRVARDRKPLCDNAMREQPDVALPLGSMAAAPVLDGRGNVVAVLYVDSFAGDARQAFVDTDLDLMWKTAQMLGATFG